MDEEPHPYTAYYCEENIYHLLSRLQQLQTAGQEHYAVLISNPSRRNLLFHQKAAEEDKGFVIWDYHAIALTKWKDDNAATKVKVWDLDTDLGLEVDFEGEHLSHVCRPRADLYYTDYYYDTFRPDLYSEKGVARVLLELDEP